MTPIPLLAALALAIGAAPPPAHAVGRLADVSVVDRASGRVLPAYYHRGEYWVAGTPGARYTLLVRNRQGERMLAVAAVDGINVLTGDTASWGQAGYVFAPWQAYQIAGWRKSNSEVAAFEFTASPNSYAERTGRPANVGVIGVALFREQLAASSPAVLWPEPAARSGPAPAPQPAPVAEDEGSLRGAPAPSAAAPAAEASSAFSGARAQALPAPAAKLGTGHGQRETSYVTQTEFVRQQPRPDEVIRIRYDSRENLVAQGVIRERAPWPPAPNPFPESPTARFVPDPPAGR